jgi:tetratricopeptide (TPR) repeat protein
MRSAWLLNSVVVHFIDVLIPLSMTVLALVFSLLINPAQLGRAGGSATSFFRLAQKVLVVIIVATVLYAGVLGILRPLAVSGRERAISDSTIARELLERAEAEIDNENFAQALRAYGAYLAIDPDNEEVISEQAAARAQLRSQEAETENPEEAGFQSAPALSGLTVGALIRRAQEYLNEEDYFSAHYYATRALDLDPDSQQAQQITARSREALQQPSASEEERETAEIFRRKRDGYLALYEQDDPIRAYYIFKRLRDERAQDPDLERFYQEALQRVQEVSFFVDDAQENVELPGHHKLLFRLDGGEGSITHVWIDKAVLATGGTYVYGLEAMSLRNGTVQYHFAADYGKLVGSVINMRGIDRDVPQRRELPQYYLGSRPAGERVLLQIPTEPSRFFRTSYAEIGLDKAGLVDLLEMRSSYAALGHRTAPVYRELLNRLVLPFAFVVLSLFSVALGRRWRSRALTRPVAGVVLAAPVLFIAAFWITRVYVYLHQAIIALLVAQLAPMGATVVLVLAETALLIVALVTFAGQRTR